MAAQPFPEFHELDLCRKHNLVFRMADGCAECARQQAFVERASAASAQAKAERKQQQEIAAHLASANHPELIGTTVQSGKLGEVGVESLDEGHYAPRPQAGKRYRPKSGANPGSFARQQRQERLGTALAVAAVVISLGALYAMGWMMRENNARQDRLIERVEAGR